MATAVQIPAHITPEPTPQITLDEYHQAIYRPDCEYIDGELKQRNVGKWEHARIQALVAGWFTAREKVWQVMAATEQRIQVSPTRVRIPDVVVLHIGEQPDVLIDPPLLITETLSPADTYSDLERRSADYQAMGVQTIWIIDPTSRSARICRGPSWVGATRLEVSNTQIAIELSDIFPYLNAANA